MVTTESPFVWLVTIAALVAIVAFDLVIIARRKEAITVRGATYWVMFYVGLAMLFAAALFIFEGSQAGTEFLAGYVTEYSLSVDNLFVFVIIMAKFAVPPIAQDKALYIGIILSLVLRAVFIAAGAAAIAAASWVFYIFGAFLIYTAVKLAFEGDDEEEEYQENVAVRSLRRIVPITPDFAGNDIITRQNGKRIMTPMLVVIVAIGIANVVFALDSIPAIFGLTQSAYIVFTANAFALMGLRQLYFLIGGLLDKIIYLNVGLSVILAFIGVKLIIEALHGSGVDHLGPMHIPEIGIAGSLGFIIVTLTVTTAVSLGKGRYDKRKVAS